MVMKTPFFEAETERIDDLPLLHGMLKKMGVQKNIDKVIRTHGNWEGVSPGWVVTIWLMHILSEKNHLMEPLEKWSEKQLKILKRITKQPIRSKDFTDDRLALCLKYLSKSSDWREIEKNLGINIIRVYDLETEIIRLDATLGSVYHNPDYHHLFKVGKAKDGTYGPQFKLMLSSIDPLGLPIAMDVLPGNKADDPLYVPIYKKTKEITGGIGKLVVGDCKMSTMATRATIVLGKDIYLTPLAHAKDEPALLEKLLEPWYERESECELIFLPEDLPQDGSAPLDDDAIAYGFEVERERSCMIDDEMVTWTERLLVVRSKAYIKTMQEGIMSRLARAEEALRNLTPSSGRGKRLIRDEASLLAAIERIEKKYRVQGLLTSSYEKNVTERQIRKYKETPARVERSVRFQIQVERNQKAIDNALFHAGWRIYVTNGDCQTLSMDKAVLVYRDQYIEENIFRRLQGKFLSITPLYIQRDDHAKGLFHLLTIAARLFALGDYLAKNALAEQERELAGIFDGSDKRSTATPTMERMLKAFKNIDLLFVALKEHGLQVIVTPLTPVQEDILALLGLPTSLYTDLQSA